MKKYTCFVISPIGEKDSEVFQEYEELFSLIIKPALEVFDIEVSRGDHFLTDEKVDDTVISQVQIADICICDVTLPRVNVYYELGRRDETGKPLILLKKKGSGILPVDIRTRRFVEYDYDLRSARKAHEDIRNIIKPLIENSFEQLGSSATLADLADVLARVERKIDKIIEANHSVSRRPVSFVMEEDSEVAPMERLRYAIRQRDVIMAEDAMERLKPTMDVIPFYDIVVEQVAAMGSAIAGKMLLDYADDFIFNTSISFIKKIEYISCMVAYANRRNVGLENLELFEKCLAGMLKESQHIDNIPDEQIADIHNQQNRLYYGIYLSTKDKQWAEKAIHSLQRAIRISPTNYLHYNITTCYWELARETGDEKMYALAKENIDKCLDFGDTNDCDYLMMACRIYKKFEEPKFSEVFAKLEKLSPIRAANLAYELRNEDS